MKAEWCLSEPKSDVILHSGGPRRAHVMDSEGAAPRRVPGTAQGRSSSDGGREDPDICETGENPAEGQVGSGLSLAALACPLARTE